MADLNFKWLLFMCLYHGGISFVCLTC